jgi:MarR family transcriptional regulator, lower aerobic nicotinate degradation pathway regulator
VVQDKPYVLEAQIGHLLRRAHQRHVAIFIDALGEGCPTPTQFAALVKLMDEGEASQNLLGRLTAMDPATVNGVVSRLVERGLVDRTQDPADQRRIALRLSARGREVVIGLLDKARLATEATLDPLSQGERKRLVALLRKIS